MPLVTFDRAGEIGLVTVDHPPVNALSQALHQALFRGRRYAQAGSGYPEATASSSQLSRIS
jgi:enoyl-CoA hydratase/carnithine racemase